MSVSAWAARHARSVLFLLLTLVAGGVLATWAMPVSLFPHIDFPRIRVNLDAGDRPAERMEAEVTRPLEESLRGIPGVRTVQSTTSRGSAEVTLTFGWGQDMTAAYLQAQAEAARLLPSLPAGTTFQSRRMDPTVFPVIAYSVTSPTRSLAALHDLCQYQLAPVLSAVPGVARIGVDGGAVEEYHVVVDPAKLAAHGLALTDLTTALSAANVLTAVGKLEDHFKLYLVVADAQFKDVDEIGDTVVRSGPGGVTKLSDVADVVRATVPQYIHSTAGGRDCVLVNVYQQPGGNTVDIAAGIRSALASEGKRLPEDVTTACWYDQSDLVTSSAHGVRDAVVIGVALAAVVLLLFLRDWRMTLVAAGAVPVVLAITAGVLYALGQTFNIMTLGGMAAAVGLIIDDAIVMAEHLVRRRDAGVAVTAAADEFARPLAGSSLSTIVIHVPPAFLVGVFGAFFAALSLAMATSLVVSFAVAWLVIPVLAGALLRRVRHREPGRVARAIDAGYARLMRLVLRVPWVALLVVIPLAVLGWHEFGRVESGLFPKVDEGGFVIDYRGPPGASIAEMDVLLGRVEKMLGETPEVQAYSRRTGFSLGGDISESNNGDFFVRLKPLPRRPLDEVMDSVRQRIASEVPGLDVDPAQLIEDLLGDLSGKPEPVVVNLFADDEALLSDLADKVAGAIKDVPGLSSVESGVVPAGDAIAVHVDRIRTALEGMDPDAVTKTLNGLLAGTVATQVQQGEKVVDVRLWTTGAVRQTTEDLGRLPLRAPDGHLFPLSRVATFTILPGQPEITRQDLKRVVYVTARSDRDLGSTIRDVRVALDRPGLIPPGVRYTLGGQYEQQQQAFKGVLGVIGAAGSLVFLLLLFLYERVRVAIAIGIVTALAVASVFVGLAVTGTELNISSMMGTVMIVGNVTEVAIFYCSEYASLPATRSRRDRLVAAGNGRLRAITMTTVAAILALLPLAVDWGHSAGMLQPLAIAIVTGLVVQLPLVLGVLPALLSMFRSAPEPRHAAVTFASSSYA
jgi:multidrug efflux pump subunit AcrB